MSMLISINTHLYIEAANSILFKSVCLPEINQSVTPAHAQHCPFYRPSPVQRLFKTSTTKVAYRLLKSGSTWALVRSTYCYSNTSLAIEIWTMWRGKWSRLETQGEMGNFSYNEDIWCVTFSSVVDHSGCHCLVLFKVTVSAFILNDVGMIDCH